MFDYSICDYFHIQKLPNCDIIIGFKNGNIKRLGIYNKTCHKASFTMYIDYYDIPFHDVVINPGDEVIVLDEHNEVELNSIINGNEIIISVFILSSGNDEVDNFKLEIPSPHYIRSHINENRHEIRCYVFDKNESKHDKKDNKPEITKSRKLDLDVSRR